MSRHQIQFGRIHHTKTSVALPVKTQQTILPSRILSNREQRGESPLAADIISGEFPAGRRSVSCLFPVPPATARQTVGYRCAQIGRGHGFHRLHIP